MNIKPQNVQVQGYLCPVMKLVMLVALFCCAISVLAQEEKIQIYNICLGEVRYSHSNEKMSSTDELSQIMRAAQRERLKCICKALCRNAVLVRNRKEQPNE